MEQNGTQLISSWALSSFSRRIMCAFTLTVVLAEGFVLSQFYFYHHVKKTISLEKVVISNRFNSSLNAGVVSRWWKYLSGRWNLFGG
jgi:hypothetical protein